VLSNRGGILAIVAIAIVAVAAFAAIGSSNNHSSSSTGTSSGTTLTNNAGLTSEETAYCDEVSADTNVMSDSFSDFSARVGNYPYCQDDTYALATDTATWQTTYDTYKNMDAPSARFATVHGLWVSGLGCYSDAADLFARGVDNTDSDLISQANAKMNEGSTYISQANDELNRIQSE